MRTAWAKFSTRSDRAGDYHGVPDRAGLDGIEVIDEKSYLPHSAANCRPVAQPIDRNGPAHTIVREHWFCESSGKFLTGFGNILEGSRHVSFLFLVFCFFHFLLFIYLFLPFFRLIYVFPFPLFKLYVPFLKSFKFCTDFLKCSYLSNMFRFLKKVLVSKNVHEF